MDLPGMRYRRLASRCRQSAAQAPSPNDSHALIRMAMAYERKACEIEADWARRVG